MFGVLINTILVLIVYLLIGKIENDSYKKGYSDGYNARPPQKNMVGFDIKNKSSHEKYDVIKDIGCRGYELVCVQSNVVIDGKAGKCFTLLARKSKNT